MLTSVFSLESYADSGGIRQAVKTAIDAHADISTWTPNASRHVVVKPNWVQESHEYIKSRWECVITHPDIVKAILSDLAHRMGGIGTISICDAPHTYAKFSGIVAHGNMHQFIETLRLSFPDLKLELIDLRREIWIRQDEVVTQRVQNVHDPRGYARYNLATDSLFYNHPGEGRYYGADYDSSVVRQHHQGTIQEYLIAGTPICADLFVNIAKLKTHKKTGITCCLKNLVGINGDKNWLPHHSEGSPSTGGDEFPNLSLKNKVETTLKSIGMRLALNFSFLGPRIYAIMRSSGKSILGDSSSVIRNGNWHGNNTCWRMVLDLNRCLLFGDIAGNVNPFHRKSYLGFVDGIQGGEGNGPICPEPVDSKVLIAGDNPAHIDAVCAKLMGYEPSKLPLIMHSFDVNTRYPIALCSLYKLIVRDYRSTSPQDISLTSLALASNAPFQPHFGWAHHLLSK
jgi:uncharacterized protein (DUF362 family)